MITRQEPEMHSSSDTLYILDLDRCLINTSLAQTLLEKAAYSVAGVQPVALQNARAEAEQNGHSFNTLAYLGHRVGDLHTMRKIEEFFCEEAKSHHGTYLLREDGADELIELLDTNNAQHIIMTCGGHGWQSLKLRASGFDMMPCLITEDKRKGHLIEKAYDEQTSFYRFPDVVPGRVFSAPYVCLIDDKAVSFEGLNEDRTWGMQVLPAHGEMLVSQQGQLPPQVIQVRGLRQVIDQLNVIIDKK